MLQKLISCRQIPKIDLSKQYLNVLYCHLFLPQAKSLRYNSDWVGLWDSERPILSSGREKQLWNETGQKASQRVCWIWSSGVKYAGVCGQAGRLQSVSERRSSLLLFLSCLKRFHRHIPIGYPYIQVWSRAMINMKTKKRVLLVKSSFEFSCCGNVDSGMRCVLTCLQCAPTGHWTAVDDCVYDGFYEGVCSGQTPLAGWDCLAAAYVRDLPGWSPQAQEVLMSIPSTTQSCLQWDSQ